MSDDASLPRLKASLSADRGNPRNWLSYAEGLLAAQMIEAAYILLEEARGLGLAGPGIDGLELRIASKAPPIAMDLSSAFARGLAYHQSDRLVGAARIYRKILAIRPDHPDALHLLGMVANRKSDNLQALRLIERALLLNPQIASYHSNFGVVLFDLGRFQDASDAYRHALRCNSNDLAARSNLSFCLYRQGEFGQAAAMARSAIAGDPGVAAAYNNLGNSLHERCELTEAASSFDRALAIAPAFFEAFQNRIFLELYRPESGLAEIAALSGLLNDRFAAPLRRVWPVAGMGRADTGDRPRIGMISGDFCAHPVGHLVLPGVQALSEAGWQITCYSNNAVEDEVSHKFRKASAQWSPIAGLSDEDAFRLIRNDAIDILIDLSGHSYRNRALLLARKPAPIQIAWAVGYPATTGLDAFDYLLADRWQLPVGVDGRYREQLIRLPHSYIAFSPSAESQDIGAPPCLDAGHVTFGSFNVLKKIAPPTISLWCEVLRRLPESRLVVKSVGLGKDDNAQLLRERFARFGVGPERLSLFGSTSAVQHREIMAQCDIALDSFPYNGGLTTLECLWQGLPVLTLPGETICSRHSLGYLSAIGLEELAAANPEDYAGIAIDLATDPDRLRIFRNRIRGRILSAPLCDAAGFAADFATALGRVWDRHCAGQAPAAIDMAPR